MSGIVEHVNVKIFAVEDEVDLSPAIEVFHRWIQQETCPELPIDVADYRHVPAGPGVVLVGHEANYSLDCAERRLGLLYNRKAPLPGTTREKIRQAFEAALAACRRLEADPAFGGRLRFRRNEAEILFNDRLLAPNDEATYRRLAPEIAAAFAVPPRLERRGGPAERLRVGLRWEAAHEL